MYPFRQTAEQVGVPCSTCWGIGGQIKRELEQRDYDGGAVRSSAVHLSDMLLPGRKEEGGKSRKGAKHT